MDIYISKKFTLGHRQPYITLGETLMKNIKRPLALFRKNNNHYKSADTFWALKNINLKVQQGEIVGIIGKNGAGKSTLLKLISRITYPTTGEIRIKGKVSSLLEVGTGFHPELTGRENVYLNGAILGMKRKEINDKYGEIVKFSEIGKFIDTPVKFYSSGMYVRLAFAVAAHLETEILVVDEVLAVGDIAFQKKCLGKIDEITHNQGRTIIFVSHNMASIRQLCTSCILLDNGKVTKRGDTADVIDYYLSRFSEATSNKSERHFKNDNHKPFQVLSIRLINNRNQTTNIFECDEEVIIELSCISRTPIPGLYGYMKLTNKEGQTVLVSDSVDIPPNTLDSLKPNKYKLILTIPARTIGHGRYFITLNFGSAQNFRGFDIDTLSYILEFTISDNSSERGNRREGFLSTLLKWHLA